jgi:hypothetical protein
MFLVITSDGRCRQIKLNETPEEMLIDSSTIGPSEIETMHYDLVSQRLFFAHHVDRVNAIHLPSGDADLSIHPGYTGWRRVDRYVITPLRWLTPQTGALGDTIAAMISGKSAFNFGTGDGESETVRRKVAGPVISCSVFTIVMLIVSCTYFGTRDF